MGLLQEAEREDYVLVDRFEQAEVLTEIWLDRSSGSRRIIQWAKLSEHTVPRAGAKVN